MPGVRCGSFEPKKNPHLPPTLGRNSVQSAAPKTQHLVLQGSDVSSTSTATSAAQPGTGPPGSVRKKRVTRRVGYARDADEVDEPAPRAKPQPAAPGQSKICSKLSCINFRSLSYSVSLS